MMTSADLRSAQDRTRHAGARKAPRVTMGDIDFLIIGAAKSATTWLQEGLLTDPAIGMPSHEVHYFSRKFELGEDWYLSQFPRGDATFLGEKSNSYLEHPAAAARMRAALPDTRLIAQLRNPVERAYSDYCMLYRRGEVNGDIDRHLDPREASETRFLQGGLYYRQLLRYFDHYPRKQVLVLLYDEVGSAPKTQLARVRAFLGLSEATTPVVEAETRVKDKSTPVLSRRLRRYLSPVKPILEPLRGTAVFDAMYRTVAWKPAYPSMSDDLRQRLRAYYEQETNLLAELLGLDLSAWVADIPSVRPETEAVRA
jgi:hypothetical protein